MTKPASKINPAAQFSTQPAPQQRTKLAEQLHSAGVTTQDTINSAWAKVHAAVDAMLAVDGQPSIKRRIVSYTLSIIAMCGVWYLAMPLILAAMMLSSFGFIGFVLATFVFLAAWYLAAKTGEVVNSMIAARSFERMAAAGWQGVKSLFDRTAVIAAPVREACGA